MSDSGQDESTLPPHWHVHERGDRSLDGILLLIELASATRPIDEILGAMCARVAEICGADVVSVYVREESPQGDMLVMRANIGFPRHSIGRISMRVGEGLTGLVAERMRPVSVHAAHKDKRYKHFPDLDEGRVPIFIGVPIMGGGRAAGVLVMQRRSSANVELDEVPLLAALAAPFSFALDNAARRVQEQQSGSRFARLSGRTLAPGVAMAKAAFVPTLASLAQNQGGEDIAFDDAIMKKAWSRLQDTLEQGRARLADALDAPVSALARALAGITITVDDQRFRTCVIDEWKQSGLSAGLRTVAQRYARVAHQMTEDSDTDSLTRRARNIEDICVFFHAAVTGQRILPPATIWLADHLGGPIALAAVTNRALALVVANEAWPGNPGAMVAEAGELPLIAGVDGLFACAAPDDLVVVNGEQGEVLINPPASAVAKVRNLRR